MRLLINGIFVFLMTSATLGQNHRMFNYNFNEGGYFLLGVRVNSQDMITDTLKEFYTDDIELLNKIKKKRTFKEKAIEADCPHNFLIEVYHNDKLCSSRWLKINCSEITLHEEYYYFDKRKLNEIYRKLKPLYSEQIKFNNIVEARNYLNEIKSDTNLLFASKPNWSEFEGEIYFNISCPSENIICDVDHDTVMKKLAQELNLKYPDEKYELEYYPTSYTTKTEFSIIITCNKSLYSKLVLLPYRLSWRPFKLQLDTFWKHKLQ